MEEAIDSLIADLQDAEKEAARVRPSRRPKAIYVCKTNIVEGEQPAKRTIRSSRFVQRRSPPILIWRYLVEHCGVEPAEIAVYCSLKFDKDFPLPEDFQLFKGGDKDYDRVLDGDFQHVIFNLSLQEGWDDPLVLLRVHRQEHGVDSSGRASHRARAPAAGARHYPSERAQHGALLHPRRQK